jgi:phosphomannomutase
MKTNDAVFGGELSGHFYFRDHYFADSGMMALAKVLDPLGREGSRSTSCSRRSAASGDGRDQLQGLADRTRSSARSGRSSGTGGGTRWIVTIEYDDWWFPNVRASNTEPLFRLNLEAEHQGPPRAEARDPLRILGKPV